jgi:FkbM family methyltransferase
MTEYARVLRRALKAVLKRTLYRPGTTATILWGPLRGCRYVVNERSGWAVIHGGWEPDEQRVFQQLIRPGQVVYDLGANTGIHALLFSRLVGPAGRVFAFEPLAENIAEIERLKILNGVTNMVVLGQAVSDHSGVTQFLIGMHPKQGSLVGIGRQTGQRVEVPIASLDDLIDGGLPPPDFVKMDIEGAESLALDGFARSLATIRPTLQIELHSLDQNRKVGAFFAKRDYRLFRVGHRRGRLLEEITDPAAVCGTLVAMAR